MRWLGPFLIILLPGCLLLPVPYFHPTVIAPKKLPEAEPIIVTKVTFQVTRSLSFFPDFPFTLVKKSVEVVDLTNCQTPAEWYVTPECIKLFIAPSMLMLLPLPGYRWDHDSMVLNVYRRGYETMQVRNGDLSTTIAWKATDTWEAREHAIDRLFFDSNAEKRSRHEYDTVEHFNFYEVEKLFVSASGKTIETVRKACVTIGMEYLALEQELSLHPHTDKQRQRVRRKHQQLQCLANALLPRQVQADPELRQGYRYAASGTLLDATLACEALQAQGIPTLVVVQGDCAVYVRSGYYRQAREVLLDSMGQFSSTFKLSE